jgi:hypothetical protein
MTEGVGDQANPSSYIHYAIVIYLTDNNKIEQIYKNSGFDHLISQFELLKGFSEVNRIEMFSRGTSGASILMHQWNRPMKEGKR